MCNSLIEQPITTPEIKPMENYLFDFIEQYMPLMEEEKKAIIDLNIFRSFKKGTVLFLYVT